MAGFDVYRLRSMDAARARLAAYRATAQNGEMGDTVKALAEVGLGAYAASRISAQLGGPEGKKILGVPVELAIAGAAAWYAMDGGNDYAPDVLAVGMGALSAYAARKGYEHGLARAKPPASVSGWPGYTEIGAGHNCHALPSGVAGPIEQIERELDRLAA
jgi:hypothetical protein